MPILGADVRSDAVSFAINNARAAGIGHLLRFSKRDLREFGLAAQISSMRPVR